MTTPDSPLLERLRNKDWLWSVPGALREEAAAEIERLTRRASLAEGELEALDRSHRDLARRLAAGGTEIERLTETIRTLARGDIVPITDKDAQIERLTAALAAERERCARLVEGTDLHGRYREWPQIGNGNRANSSEIVQHCDRLANALRRGDEQQARCEHGNPAGACTICHMWQQVEQQEREDKDATS